MQLWRRVRGLLGIALTWGALGAGIGAVLFVARYQPWSSSTMHWSRMMTLFDAFIGLGARWGSVCGLAFGLVLWSTGRSRRFQQLSAQQLTLWGAIGGAAFPILLYTHSVVLFGGAHVSVPFFGMLAGISAVFGAVCGWVVFALAERAPEAIDDRALLGALFGRDPEIRLETRARVR